MCVPFAGVLKKFEVFVAEIKELAAKSGGVRCCPCTVSVVMAVVFPARIVEDSEQADNCFESSSSCCQKQTVAFNSTPM